MISRRTVERYNMPAEAIEALQFIDVEEVLQTTISPLPFARAMRSSAGGAIVMRFEQPDNHALNLQLAESALSSLGPITCVYPHDGVWSDLSVNLAADPRRTHGVGENPFHMDMVDREFSPRYIALYCQRSDPRGGGGSMLSDVRAALERLSPPELDTLAKPAFSYFADQGVFGVGKHLERFPIVPPEPNGFVRFTSKMLPHLEKGELFDPALASPSDVVSAFSSLTSEVKEGRFSYRLEEGEMLVFDQFRFAHARMPLGDGQENVPINARRLLRQTYVSSAPLEP